ncbi:MAG: hypothetical protein HQK87_11305 [Nitrospinae bacterium]|nr:hypothetical protein [Nitrospinota bacterium]
MASSHDADFNDVLTNIERLCLEYHRMHNPYMTRLVSRREGLISEAFHQIREVTDLDEAYSMADRLTGLLRSVGKGFA